MIHRFTVGGGETALLKLMPHLVAHCGPQVVVAVKAGGPLERSFRDAGAETVVLGRDWGSIRRPLRWARDLRATLASVRAEARHRRADLLAAHVTDMDTLAAVAARSTGLPVVPTYQSSSLFPANRQSGFRRRLRQVVLRRTVRSATAIVAVSEAVRDSLVQHGGVDPARVSVIPNAVDVPPLPDPDTRRNLRSGLLASLGIRSPEGASGASSSTAGPAPFLLLSVGRLVPNKAQADLIHAFSRIVRSVPGVRLLFAGDGPDRGALEALARRTPGGERIHFLGERHDIDRLLLASDLFVLPSLWEGLSLALLEAMALARPCVACRVPGNVELIEPERTGILVPPADPPALAQAIVRVLNAPPAYRQALGKNARAVVEDRYSAARSGARLAALYRRAANATFQTPRNSP